MLKLTINTLASDASGVARTEDSVVFVKGALPGEEVLATVTETRRKYRRAVLTELLTCAPERREPRCPYFGRCGGCALQHMSYEATLYWKKQWVSDALRRVGGSAQTVEPVWGMAEPWGYRHRAVFHVQDGKVGFYAENSHNLVEFVGDGLARPTNTEASECLLLAPGLIAVAIKEARTMQNGDLPLALTPAGEIIRQNYFTQTNREQAERLYAETVRLAALTGRETVWDLYAGAGELTARLAVEAAHVVAVESNAEAVTAAAENGKIEWLLTGVEQALREQLPPPDVIVADPPRAGLTPEVAIALRESGCRRLIYISCHPAALARDIAILTAGDASCAGLRVALVQPLDMFCWCTAVETICLRERERHEHHSYCARSGCQRKTDLLLCGSGCL